MTAVMISPAASVVSISGVLPGRQCNSEIGIIYAAPSALTISTWASSARIATAMSEGCVAMH